MWPFNLFKNKRSTLRLNIDAKDVPDSWRVHFTGKGKSKVIVNEQHVLAISAFFRAVNLVSEQIAAMGFDLILKKADNTVKQLDENFIEVVLSKGITNSFLFLESIVKIVMLRGNCYVRCIYDSIGQLEDLEILKPNVKPIIFKDSESGKHYYSFGEKQTYSSAEILHFRNYVVDGVFGMNPILLFTETFGINIALIDYLASYFGNGAFLSGILSTEKPLLPDQTKSLEASWQDKYGGVDRTGKTPVLHSGLRYQAVSSNPTDSASIPVKKSLVEEISNITGVPIVLLSQLEKANFSTIEELNKLFVQYCLRGWVVRLEKEFYKIPIYMNKPKMKVRFNIDSLLRADTKTRTEYFEKAIQNRWMSPNEVRGIENMNPYDGGDKYEHPLLQYKQQQSNSNPSTNEPN